MKKCTLMNKKIMKLLAIILILGLWQFLSFFSEPSIIPPLKMIFKELSLIFTDISKLEDIRLTLIRLAIAMSLSISLGLILGTIFSNFPVLKGIVKEILKIFQVVPPVSILILAIMVLGFNGKPAIFIVSFFLIPLISINVMDAIDNIDKKLLEMARVYNLSRLRHIYLPAIENYFLSTITVSLTIGTKLIVMAEVLTTTSGIGGRIMTARLNLEPETLIAWTIVMLFIYYTLENFVSLFKNRKRFKNIDYFGVDYD